MTPPVIYCPYTDKFRLVTQADVDAMMRRINACGHQHGAAQGAQVQPVDVTGMPPALHASSFGLQTVSGPFPTGVLMNGGAAS